LKFIIFIDDLAFNKSDDNFSMLKAALEGSASAKADNAVIYATSNRRHIIKESFGDRDGDDVHRNDTLQETLSLSERFGLVVLFSKPNKQLYLEIVRELAKKHGVTILSENLLWGASIDPRIISKLVERMDSAYFGWCYDIGHANCQEVDVCIIDQKDIITPLSLHLQDNNGIFHKDEHLIPGDGNINWERFLKALAKSGYKGDFVLEAHHQSREAPDDQREAILKRLFCKAEELKAQYLKIKGEIQ
jgi:hypothetical protein